LSGRRARFVIARTVEGSTSEKGNTTGMKSRRGLFGSKRGSWFSVKAMKKLLPLFLLFTGTAYGQGINSALVYVGGSVPQWGNNPDMGAQINTAYASCPATGCTIVLVPQTNGACYDFSTPIVFTTVSKYALLQGSGPTSEAPGPVVSGVTLPGPAGGTCLNFTPTTATSAMTFDYVPLQGGGNVPVHGIRDIILQNNGCQNIGGCGSLATGIQLGGSNSGAQNGEIANARVNGFGTGISFMVSGTQSWGVVLRSDSIVNNTIGISFAGSLENISLFGGRVAGNDVGFSLIGNADVYAHGVSIDSNVTAGVKAISGIFSCTNCHWENLSAGPSIATHYYIGSGAASLVIEGGKAIDNINSPTPEMDYWFSNAGTSTYIHGLLIYSGGRKATQVVQSINPCAWWVSIYNASPSVLTTLTGGPSQQGVLFPNDFNSGVASVQTQFLIPNLGATFTPSNVQMTPGWGSTAYVDDSFGTSQRFSFVVHSTGVLQGLGPTLEITFPTPWPVPPFYVCKMVGGTGAFTPIYGEATANTAKMTLSFLGTPVAGSSYQIQCVGE
jgi:hypothetical protein